MYWLQIINQTHVSRQRTRQRTISRIMESAASHTEIKMTDIDHEKVLAASDDPEIRAVICHMHKHGSRVYEALTETGSRYTQRQFISAFRLLCKRVGVCLSSFSYRARRRREILL